MYPCPKQADPAKWALYEPMLQQQVELLTAAGVKVTGTDPDNTYGYLQVEYAGLPGSIDILALSNLSLPEVRALVSILPRFAEIAKRTIEGSLRPGSTWPEGWPAYRGDVFYSHLSLVLSDFRGYECRHLLYSWLANIMRRAMIYVHS